MGNYCLIVLVIQHVVLAVELGENFPFSGINLPVIYSKHQLQC